MVLTTQEVTNSFVAGLRTIDDLKMKLTDPRRFLLGIQPEDSIDRTWKRFEETLTLHLQNPGTNETIGQQLLNHSSGILLQVNQIIYKAKRYPLVQQAVVVPPAPYESLVKYARMP
jgi:hypothetical protein